MTAKNCTIPVAITVDGPASNHTCPRCGYCPHCKRDFKTYTPPYTPALPYQPWANPYPWYQPVYVGDVPPFYTITCTSTGTTGDTSSVTYATT